MKKDLVVLAADKDMEHALKGLFTRPEALDIRPIQVDILVHPQHDPACARRGVAFLSNLSERYRHGLLMFDHKGSGREQESAQDIQRSLDAEFSRSAWGDRAKDDCSVTGARGVDLDRIPSRRGRHRMEGPPPAAPSLVGAASLAGAERSQAHAPKEAFQAALRESRRPRSASLYQQIATRVSLRHCTDQSFLEFKTVLRRWFSGD